MANRARDTRMSIIFSWCKNTTGVDSFTMMGWFGNSNNNDSDDMDTTDGGKEAFVFRDDEDEDEETAQEEQPKNQDHFLSSFLEVGGDKDEENEEEDKEENPPAKLKKEDKDAVAFNDDEEKDIPMERAPASHRNPLFTLRRFWSELCCCQSWFHLSERVNQRELDIPESFAPYSFLAFLWKCVLAGTCVGTMTYTFLDAQHPEYVLAFLTQWAALAATLYSIMSVINTIFAARTPQPHSETTGFRIRLTWVLFELAIHLGSCASLLFWVFLFDKDEHVEYLELATHGGLLILVLFDGFYVNRIPLRWMHYFGIILPIEVLYGVWTYVHHVTDIGNPNLDMEGSNGNDNALYPDVVQWDDGWEEPLAYVLVIVLAVGPILFSVLWCVGNGLLCCHDTRRYFDDPVIDEDGRPTVDDVQEGTLTRMCVIFVRY